MTLGLHPDVLKIVLHYEKNYYKVVTSSVRTWKKKKKLLPHDNRIIKLRNHFSSFFWAWVRSRIINEDFVQELMKIMAKRRKLNDHKIYRKMGFDKYGKLITYDSYYEEEPLMYETELNPTGIALDVHIIHRNLCCHIPFFTIAQCSKSVGDRMFDLHQDILDHIAEKKLKPKKDKAHKGFSLLNTCVSGGDFACDAEGISGSVHWSNFFLDNIDLRNKAIRIFQEMILTAFGDCLWFQNLVAYFHCHDNPHLSDRLIPCLPISHGWLSKGGRAKKFHVDSRNIGVCFLFVPRTYTGGELVVTDPSFEYCRTIHLEQYDVIAGHGFRSNHYNLPCTDELERNSYAFYLDYRVAHSGYIHIEENMALEALKH